MFDLSFASSMLAVAGLLVLVFGIFLWLIQRLYQKKIWLPLLSIIPIKKSLLPKIIIKKPPYIPFLLFFLSSLLLSFLLFKPFYFKKENSKEQQKKIHIFLDLSSSVSENLTFNDYKDRIKNIFNSFEGSAISFSSSMSSNVLPIRSAEELDVYLAKLSYHRPGLLLGSALRLQMPSFADVKNLFIVSDGDQYSFSDFNLNFFSKDMEIYFIPVKESYEKAFNAFINQVVFKDSENSPGIEATIDIHCRYHEETVKGFLAGYSGDKMIASSPWTIQKDKEKISIKVFISDKDFLINNKKEKKVIVWKLLDFPDAIELDNTFKTYLESSYQNILLVSDIFGEQFLEDPVYQAMTSLRVLHFLPERIHWFKRDIKPLVEQFPLWMIFFDPFSDHEKICPMELSDLKRQASLEGMPLSTGLHIWLIPNDTKKSFSSICKCYAELVLKKSKETKSLDFCEGIHSREEFNEVMRSLGAKQLGGDIFESRQAFGWSYRDHVAKLEVSAFGVPLRPLKETGISHAKLPILLKELLLWQGMVADKKNQMIDPMIYPRVANMIDLNLQISSGDSSTSYLESNVPFGESLMLKTDQKDLPTFWDVKSKKSITSKYETKKDTKKDPLPFIYFALTIVLICIFLEILWYGIRKRKNFILIFILCSFYFLEKPSFASVEMIYLGKEPRLSTLSESGMNIERRTSLHLEFKVKNYSQLNHQILYEPWIWAEDLSLITDEKGFLIFELAHWLKRGGLLILMGHYTSAELEKITSHLTGLPEFSGSWSVIPPDHELMRSFYLLDALPVCGDEIWRGFLFDKRIAAITIPFDFISLLSDDQKKNQEVMFCGKMVNKERFIRPFINLMMVALATDYKKDQIHMKEILKRLK